MGIKQISVFLENKMGRLSDVTDILAKGKINIRALSLAETADFGILRLIVNDPDKAIDVLKDNNFVAQATEVIAVEVKDTPGGLHKILSIFSKNNISVEYMYAFVEKNANNAIVVFKIDEHDKAINILKENNIERITNDILKNL